MEQFLKRQFKRISVKYKLWLRYKSFSRNDSSFSIKNEITCKTICYKLINHDGSKFLIAPISGKRYIKNDNLGLFVVLEDRRITITNHIYHYDVVLQQRDWDRITKMYDDKTERIRLDYEVEMMSQINHSLQTILEKLN
jgi:hypothetical protein